MQSPAVAMLWENWRLTRNESAQRLVQGIVVSAAILAGAAAFGSVGNGTASKSAIGAGLAVARTGDAGVWLAIAGFCGTAGASSSTAPKSSAGNCCGGCGFAGAAAPTGLPNGSVRPL